MKYDLNNLSMVATAISGYLFVILTGGAWFRWWFRHNIKEIVAELKPNGGKSIKDTVNRIEIILAKLEGKFEQHIEEHK
jgi:hypothetical protein